MFCVIMALMAGCTDGVPSFLNLGEAKRNGTELLIWLKTEVYKREKSMS